jgi:sugar/nucleoside kinase (ribokinase family)
MTSFESFHHANKKSFVCVCVGDCVTDLLIKSRFFARDFLSLPCSVEHSSNFQGTTAIIDRIGRFEIDQKRTFVGNISSGGCEAIETYEGFLEIERIGLSLANSRKEGEEEEEEDERDRVRERFGGSAANVARAIAKIRSNSNEFRNRVKIRFSGTIGNDSIGERFVKNLVSEHEIECEEMVRVIVGERSARCLSFVEESGQRTMRTYLGAAKSKPSIDCILDAFRDDCERTNDVVVGKMLHVEGYALYDSEFFLNMVEKVKEGNDRGERVVVSIDLASFEVVRKSREALMRIFSDDRCKVDCVFCNEDEALALVETLPELFEDVGEYDVGEENRNKGAFEAFVCEAIARKIKGICVVTRGKEGCVCCSYVEEEGSSCPTVFVPAPGIKAIDTTGAGDTFTAAFLFAKMSGRSLFQCCEFGCSCAARVCLVQGASLSDAEWKSVCTRAFEDH